MEKTESSPHRAQDRGRYVKGWHREPRETPQTCGPPPADWDYFRAHWKLGGAAGHKRTRLCTEQPRWVLLGPWDLGKAGLSRVGAENSPVPAVRGGAVGRQRQRPVGTEEAAGGRRHGRRGAARGKEEGRTPARGRLPHPLREKAPRPGEQTAGGRAAEAPTHPAKQPIRAAPLPTSPPAAGGVTHRYRCRRSGDRTGPAWPASARLGAAAGPGSRGGTGHRRARPRPPHNSRETPPGLTLRHNTAPARLSPNDRALHRHPSNHKFLSLPAVSPLPCQPMGGRSASAPRPPPVCPRGQARPGRAEPGGRRGRGGRQGTGPGVSFLTSVSPRGSRYARPVLPVLAFALPWQLVKESVVRGWRLWRPETPSPAAFWCS